MAKTKAQLEEELRMIKVISEERELSDSLYAMKIVEKIVFGMVGLILVVVLSSIIGLVVLR